MPKFTTMLEQSKAIHRFAEVERMTQDDIYEFYYDCYSRYESMFTERIKHSQHLRHIISEYRHIPEFQVLRPSEIARIVFTSRHMAYWFAFQWWSAIDKQVRENRIDKVELQIELTFMGRIPSATTMEEILHEQKSKKDATHRILSARQAAEVTPA